MESAAVGSLLRGRFDDYADVVAGPGFDELLGAGIFLVDRGLLSALATAQALASANGLKVRANQIFRVEGAVVSGAVIAPAGFSAHRLGRAIDLNAAIGEAHSHGWLPLPRQCDHLRRVGMVPALASLARSCSRRRLLPPGDDRQARAPRQPGTRRARIAPAPHDHPGALATSREPFNQAV